MKNMRLNRLISEYLIIWTLKKLYTSSDDGDAPLEEIKEKQ